jgi:hypothetical protein
MTSSPDSANPPAWSTALFSLVHPAKIAAVEAYAFIGEPMSALLVYEVLGHEWAFGTVAYHVRRLAEAGVLTREFVEPVRGAHEHFFGLAT